MAVAVQIAKRALHVQTVVRRIPVDRANTKQEQRVMGPLAIPKRVRQSRCLRTRHKNIIKVTRTCRICFATWDLAHAVDCLLERRLNSVRSVWTA